MLQFSGGEGYGKHWQKHQACPKNAPRVRLALWVLVGVYLAAILPVLLAPGKPGVPMELAYLVLATIPGHGILRVSLLLLGAAFWLFRSAPPREQSST